jgi:hypothetical protein
MSDRIITPHINDILGDDPVSLENLSQIVDHCYERSKLKKSGVSTYDKDLRNSYTMYNAVLDMDEESVIRALCDWNRISGFSQFKAVDSEHTTIGYDKTLIYAEGGFFASHTDGSVNSSHVGTLVILPPKSLSPYEGGELYVNDNSSTSDETEWTFVYIKLNQSHRVDRVVSGLRVAFKYNVYDNTPVPERPPIVKWNFDDQICDDYHSEELEDDFSDDLDFGLFD